MVGSMALSNFGTEQGVEPKKLPFFYSEGKSEKNRGKRGKIKDKKKRKTFGKMFCLWRKIRHGHAGLLA